MKAVKRQKTWFDRHLAERMKDPVFRSEYQKVLREQRRRQKEKQAGGRR
jgi:hypothetical protein